MGATGGDRAVPDPVQRLEVVPDVEDRLSAGCGLDDLEEGEELPTKVVVRRPIGTVLGQLDVDGRREGVRVLRHHGEEMARLDRPRRAEREEVVGPSPQPGAARTRPVRREPFVDGIVSLGGLDVGEVDAIGGHEAPIDLSLMVRDVDAPALTAAEGGSVIR